MTLGLPATANKEEPMPGTSSQKSVDEMREMFESVRHYITFPSLFARHAVSSNIILGQLISMASNSESLLRL